MKVVEEGEPDILPLTAVTFSLLTEFDSLAQKKVEELIGSVLTSQHWALGPKDLKGRPH